MPSKWYRLVIFFSHLVPFINGSQREDRVWKSSGCSNKSSDEHEAKQWIKLGLTIHQAVSVDSCRKKSSIFCLFYCHVWRQCQQRVRKSIQSFNLMSFNFGPPRFCDGQLWVISKMLFDTRAIPIQLFLFLFPFNFCSIDKSEKKAIILINKIFCR